MDSCTSGHCPEVQWAGRVYMGVESRLSGSVVQWTGRLCIRVEFSLSGCTTGLLTLDGYTLGQLAGCATGQTDIVQLYIRIARCPLDCVAGHSTS